MQIESTCKHLWHLISRPSSFWSVIRRKEWQQIVQQDQNEEGVLLQLWLWLSQLLIALRSSFRTLDVPSMATAASLDRAENGQARWTDGVEGIRRCKGVSLQMILTSRNLVVFHDSS